MARKLKIEIDFNQDNTLIGISCHKKDYWIAFNLNEKLNLNLKRIEDLPVYNSKLDLLISYPLFSYHSLDTHSCYYLFSNHNPEGKIFPALKAIDFFLLINGLANKNEISEKIGHIKKIPNILTAYKIDLSKVKDFEGLLSDLELHIMEKEIAKR